MKIDRPQGAGADTWSVLTKSHEPLFRKHISAHEIPLSYERGWAYIRQQARLQGHWILYHGVLSTAVIKDHQSPFVFLLPPIGPEAVVLRLLPALAASLVKTTSKRVVLRKAPAAWEEKLGRRGFRRVEPQAFQLAVDYPEDVYPQLVLETKVADTLRLPRLQKTRNQLTFFNKSYEASLATMHLSYRQALNDLVDRWAAAHNLRGDFKAGAVADAGAYHCLINDFAHRIDDKTYFGLVLAINNSPVGFCFAERSGPSSAALYASLTLRGLRGASEFLLVSLLSHLEKTGIRSINLGGSETLSLFRFKKKFDPVMEIHTVELGFEPNKLRE